MFGSNVGQAILDRTLGSVERMSQRPVPSSGGTQKVAEGLVRVYTTVVEWILLMLA